MATFFNEYFNVSVDEVEDYSAFNISIINDLPLFIDPFLLFNSEKAEYQQLHSDIIKYMGFLRDAVCAGRVTDDLQEAWFMFPEVRQNWLGFSLKGNGGTGLGRDFAKALRTNLQSLFADFGKEKITRGSHLEKLCLVRDGIGRDNISDFTTNLVKDFLCRYTQEFAQTYIDKSLRRKIWVNKAIFNYTTESWERRQYELPVLDGDFVILTPKDMLTRDENWINRADLIHNFEQVPIAIPDAQLRAQVFNYFERVLIRHDDKEPTQRERAEAAVKTILSFPQIVDYYIKIKEDNGEEAEDISKQKVLITRYIFETQVRELQNLLRVNTQFYALGFGTYEESHQRLAYFKDVIENKGGHRIFFHEGKPIQRESDVQILFRFTWFGSPSDVGTEANDGRGPVDYKISRGAFDKTLIEMKLAKNTGLERNLKKQLEIYQAASDAKKGIKVIVYFSAAEKQRVDEILERLQMTDSPDIILIDARDDNKPELAPAIRTVT